MALQTAAAAAAAEAAEAAAVVPATASGSRHHRPPTCALYQPRGGVPRLSPAVTLPDDCMPSPPLATAEGGGSLRLRAGTAVCCREGSRDDEQQQ